MLALKQLKRCITANYHCLRLSSTAARLSQFDVDTILTANEYTQEFEEGFPVKYFESNQLASNNPIEDSRSEAMCLSSAALLFGVFDGHGKSLLVDGEFLDGF